VKTGLLEAARFEAVAAQGAPRAVHGPAPRQRTYLNGGVAHSTVDVLDERRDIATLLKGASAAEVPVSLMKRVR
jgi:hypothetical protein